MNEYDAARVYDTLAAQEPCVKVMAPREADLIVLITCAVRAKATEKVFSELGRLFHYRKQNPDLMIAVGGCVAREAGELIFRRAPYVNIVFSPQTLHHLPALVTRARQGEKKILDLEAPSLEKFSSFPPTKIKAPTAFVSIMEGCNHFCSYCIVPFTRGREVSRPFSQILEEVQVLVAGGVHEIHLLGQNVNGYRDPETSATLADLIHKIALIPEVWRIRFTTSHPVAFSDELIAAFAEPKLANHLHLPLQSGSDRILQLMRRGYTLADYCTIVEKIRRIRPEIALSTDIIVGFPGETDDDFAATLAAAQEISYDTSFSFIYSPRPGTKAATLPDQIPLKKAKARLEQLHEVFNSSAQQYTAKMVGKIEEVLVTDRAKLGSQLTGRTSNNKIVNFAGPISLCGQMARIKITEALPNSLRGELVAEN